MPSTTTHYGIRKPNGSESANGVLAIGETADDVDSALYGHASAATLDHPDGSVTTAKLADQGVSNVKLGADVARPNLLTNGSAGIWQRGAGPFAGGAYGPDQWISNMGAGGTLSVTRTNPADGKSLYAATLAYTHGSSASSWWQKFGDGDARPFKGKTLALSVEVKTSTPGAVSALLNDGVAAVNGTTHTGDGTWQTLTVTHTWDPSATATFAGLLLSASATVEVRNAMLVVGGVPTAYAPLPPADELARCQRYYQRWNATSGGQMIGSGQCYDTVHAILILPMAVTMGGVPTLTTSAVTDWELTGATANGIQLSTLALAAYLGHAARLDAAVAAGLVAGNATLLGSWSGSPNAWLALEWNP